MKEIFNDSSVLQNFDQVRSEMVLKEDTTGQSIIVGGIPNNAILLKLDVDKREFKIRSAYLRRDLEFIHKGCDYCLILPDNNLALLFELKSYKPKGYANQFVASELFIEYCVKLWNKFQCNNLTLTYKRVLLSPKYNQSFTSSKKLHSLTVPDRCKNDVNVVSPGFPARMRLEKLL